MLQTSACTSYLTNGTHWNTHTSTRIGVDGGVFCKAPGCVNNSHTHKKNKGDQCINHHQLVSKNVNRQKNSAALSSALLSSALLSSALLSAPHTHASTLRHCHNPQKKRKKQEGVRLGQHAQSSSRAQSSSCAVMDIFNSSFSTRSRVGYNKHGSAAQRPFHTALDTPHSLLSRDTQRVGECAPHERIHYTVNTPKNTEQTHTHMVVNNSKKNMSEYLKWLSKSPRGC